MIRAFVLASSVPNNHESVIEKLAAHVPNPIREVHTTTGHYNLMLDVETPTAEEMSEFIFGSLHEMRDVLKTRVYYAADPELAGASEEDDA